MNILITGALTKDAAFFSEIEKLGHKITYLEDERVPLTAQNVDPSIFEGVFCNSLFLHTPIERFKRLRYIQLTSAGLDRVPSDYIKAHGIKLNTARGVYSIPMAEFALMGVLSLYKKSEFFRENQRRHRWEKNRGLNDLYGKTVCIVGCGDAGDECAKRFEAFGCKVLGVARSAVSKPHFERIYPVCELMTALSESDITVLTVPLSDETYHLFDAEAFAALKDGAIFINISRGAVADTEALSCWLKSPRSGGAVLDVFENEPLSPNSPLWDMEKVIVSPHNSFVGDNNSERLKAQILLALREYNE